LTLKASILEFDPDGKIYVLITDLNLANSDFVHSENIVFKEELDLTNEELIRMENLYDRIEFATSLKPFLLDKLISVCSSTVMYLDPDILVFASLSDGFQKADETGLALTPHRLSPDINHPDRELKYLKFGVFNLGFIAVNYKSREFLKWWQEKLKWECFNAPEEGMYTDQKWIDLVPSYFQYSLISNPGYNVAFWNINERKISKTSGTYFVNNTPLAFVHFSNMSSKLIKEDSSELWSQYINTYEDDLTLMHISEITQLYHKKLKFNKDFLNLANINSSAKNMNSLIYRFKVMEKLKIVDSLGLTLSHSNFLGLFHRFSSRLLKKLYCLETFRLFHLGLFRDVRKFRRFLKNLKNLILDIKE
jgi:hypothetical protein